MTEIQDPPIPRRHDARLLLEDLACVCGRAMTCGTSEVGDRGLWELLGAAMQSAETRLADLTSDLAATG